jgi:hypothetical protein
MKPITADEVDAVGDEWKQRQSFPWVELLYNLSRFNIQSHLSDHPFRILDVGGGFSPAQEGGLNAPLALFYGVNVMLLFTQFPARPFSEQSLKVAVML